MFITLHAKLSSTVYCNRSCLWVYLCMCVCVCGSVTMITRNCVHRSSPNWVLSEGSDHLQLIKFGHPAASGRGLRQGENFWLRLTTASTVFVSLSTFLNIALSCEMHHFLYHDQLVL